MKLRCSTRQEFVIGGYTDPKGEHTGFGSLLVGYHDRQGALRYAGKVGTGFDAQTHDGRLRHPRFLGLRHDKAPSEVVREDPHGSAAS